jgi:putative Mn2+ efflux pump MntP
VDEILSGIAVLTVALATLELGQTIVEEEVQRATVMSAPTRVRRFLSRFMIVLVVALSIEALVDVFQYSHTDPSMLPNAALIGFMAAVLLAAWGLFIRLNRSVEEMEPEALQRVREEDKRVKAEGLGAAGATVDEELSDEGF